MGLLLMLSLGHVSLPSAGEHPLGHHHGSTGLRELEDGSFRIVTSGEPGSLARQGVSAFAFRPSGAPISSARGGTNPRAEVFNTGTNALEPTLGIDPEGRVFFIGMDGEQWPVFPTQTMRTSNDGKTWDDVTPPPPQDHVTTEDPYIYVDEVTGRVFSTDFLAPCHAVSRSDDAGATWTSTVTACDLLDHQTVFAGKPITSQPIGYPRVVYYCAIDPATATPGVSCLKSIDGGQTFLRTGAAAFPGVDQPGRAMDCSWGSGHGVAGPDGAIYLPAGVCSTPTLAISRDEGLTWKRVQVADMKMGSDGRVDHDAAVAVDTANNLYFSWTGADLKPYLSVSRDGGSSWSKPVMIAPPGVRIATLIALDVAAPGNLAVSFIGSEKDKVFGEGEFNGYMMVTTQGLGRDPLFYASRINPLGDPLDNFCTTGHCTANREFIDVAIAPDGSAWASFSDGCFEGSCGNGGKPFIGIVVGRGLAARLVGGPRLN